MSCCGSIQIPNYRGSGLRPPRQQFSNFVCNVPFNVFFFNCYDELNKYFGKKPYRVTIVDSNGAVIYDNVVPTCYWAKMGNLSGYLEFQLAVLGAGECRAVVRTEYPCCPYGPYGNLYGPAAIQGDYYQCSSNVCLGTGCTGTAGTLYPCGTGSTGTYDCSAPPPFPCNSAPAEGFAGCTGAGITYEFVSRIYTCNGRARWVRIGTPVCSPQGLSTACCGGC